MIIMGEETQSNGHLEYESIKKDLMGQKKTVLLVEDDESHMILGRILLERLGFQVQISTDGENAIQLFSKNPDLYYFVMTDYSMVPMNGMELAERLLKIQPSAAILLCTGRDDVELIRAAKNIGVRNISLKPSNRIEMEDLLISSGLFQSPD